MGWFKFLQAHWFRWPVLLVNGMNILVIAKQFGDLHTLPFEKKLTCRFTWIQKTSRSQSQVIRIAADGMFSGMSGQTRNSQNQNTQESNGRSWLSVLKLPVWGCTPVPHVRKTMRGNTWLIGRWGFTSVKKHCISLQACGMFHNFQMCFT